jgi:hypothetical protein
MANMQADQQGVSNALAVSQNLRNHFGDITTAIEARRAMLYAYAERQIAALAAQHAPTQHGLAYQQAAAQARAR